jgi:hypothetical protein
VSTTQISTGQARFPPEEFNWAGPGYKPGDDDQNRVKIDEMEAARLTLP